MGAIDENAAKIAQFIAWVGEAINNVADLQNLINARLDEIQHEQRRQARILAFVQRRQRAGGKLTRNLLAKQNRAMRFGKLRFRGIGDESPIERLRSYDITVTPFVEEVRPRGYHGYQNWADSSGTWHHDAKFFEIPPLSDKARALVRVELLDAAAKIGPIVQVTPPSTCDTCGTELIDNCLRCGAPVCCPHCCAETEHNLGRPDVTD